MTGWPSWLRRATVNRKSVSSILTLVVRKSIFFYFCGKVDVFKSGDVLEIHRKRTKGKKPGGGTFGNEIIDCIDYFIAVRSEIGRTNSSIVEIDD